MDALLAFARLYVDRLPDSEVRALTGSEDQAVTEFFGGVDWYCDKWPGLPLVTFFSDTEHSGMIATHQVNVETGEAYLL